ncbi:membrane protein [Neptunitalea chrysea]|uniref:Membrane protein n=1 Tax=Neptunitalea chrysea TaxID=1647581 RepID=A0A9W6EVJ0_9FLAO|nr:RagB/SusD family nutrient uptake outer membrane protein [Neptunitalea chrysea]GLB53884.1 membrane protein [Neptunitalea chrysea]
MKKISIYIAIVLSVFTISCNDEDWLERNPETIITDDQLWNDSQLIKSLLANYYNRLPSLHGVFNTGGMCETDEAMWSGTWDANWRNNFDYSNNYGTYWDYDFVRDLNLALDNIEQYSTELGDDEKNLYNAEIRFIRAFVYFEMVKRMGGVPLVTEQLVYNYDGDVSNLQIARSKEYEIYDFIYSEMEDIKSVLEGNNGSTTRANYYTALALESRSMLYAGSLAKYNNLMSSPITLPGEEVGIPASMANGYYTKSLQASQELINNGGYALYNENPDKGINFYEMLMSKSSQEIIFAKDYELSLKVHRFAYDNIPKSLTEDNESSSTISPSLNLVESFEYLDGSEGTLENLDANGDYITYTNIDDIFANKDARLYGTIIYPGSSFKSTPVSIQAGVAIWNGSGYDFTNGSNLGDYYTDGDILTGFDGPKDNEPDVSNTGFYIRKFVSEESGASTRVTSADNWWPYYRLGEIYLNATEAAYELGQESVALPYINAIRERAGFPANSLTSLSIETIQHERRVELAFENHRYFDVKRWRIADQLWDNDWNNEDAVVHGLFPYRVIRPGHENNNKYIFKKVVPARFLSPRYFRMANYYSLIYESYISNNPLLVKNPFH